MGVLGIQGDLGQGCYFRKESGVNRASHCIYQYGKSPQNIQLLIPGPSSSPMMTKEARCFLPI